MKKMMIVMLALLFVSKGVMAQTKEDTTNLIPNGHFDDPKDPLNYWIYAFDHNSHYMDNYKAVSVVEDPASARKHVMRITCTDGGVLAAAGYQVYSPIMRYDPKKKYKISFSARSTLLKGGGKGPSCRIYPIAYRWHPKAVKSNNPTFNDLREEARLQPFYFGGQETGPFSDVPNQWKRIERMIPTPGRSELQQTHLESCVFLMVKFMIIDGDMKKCGYLDIDDVKIEEAGLVDVVKIKAGSATKGFDGKSWKGDASQEQKKLKSIGKPIPAKGVQQK